MINNLFNKKIKKTKEEKLSYSEYIELVEKEPITHLRNTANYIRSVFDYFGRNKNGGFSLFSKKDPDTQTVYGNEKIQEIIYRSLNNFVEEGFNNKFLLLTGPNGTAKTSIVKKIMKSCEKYSELDEGALYTFSWIFPVSNSTTINGTSNLGLLQNKNKQDIKSFAYLKNEDISSIVSSELLDHPILLLPREYRDEFIKKTVKDTKKLKEIKKTYLWKGDLSQKNKLIFDALLKEYDGDHLEVLKHVRIERYYISKRYSKSAVTIEPQLHIDAKMQQFTMDKRLHNLPAMIQALNLHSMSGELVSANRGILEYSDLFKRNPETFKYLLMSIEQKNINMNGILTELDILFMGTSNEIHYDTFKQNPDFNSYKGRFKVIHVPYLLNYKNEIKIYEEQVGKLRKKDLFEPNSLECFALWNIMTRLVKPKYKNYKPEMSSLMEKINSLDKALLYAGEDTATEFGYEELEILKTNVKEIKKEHFNEVFYEGRFGISPRESKEILYDITSNKESVSFLDVLNYLKDIDKHESYKQLRDLEEQNKDYFYSFNKERVELLSNYFFKKLDEEVRDSLVLIDAKSYESYIKKYFKELVYVIKNEKVRNNVTGKFEDPNLDFIKEFEHSIGVSSMDQDSFRTKLMAMLGDFKANNPDEKIVYCELFNEIIYKKLKNNFINEQRLELGKISKDLIFYEERNSNLNKEQVNRIESLLLNMKKRHGYSTDTAIQLVQELVKNEKFIS